MRADHIERRSIDVGRALAQHQAYRDVLRGVGIQVVELHPDPAQPDGIFVEDTAVVLDELAVITSLRRFRGGGSGPRSRPPCASSAPRFGFR